MAASVIPIDRPRTAPALSGVERNRLLAERQKAADRATAASLRNRPRLYANWFRAVEKLDETLRSDGAA